MRVSDWEAELDASYPAQPSQVTAIRRAVADIARARGAPDTKLVQITLAVSEAASNAILHAYRDGRATPDADVRVLVRACDDSCLDVRIRDRGVGLGPRADSPGLGLGLGLIAQVADSADVRAPESGGTEVLMRFNVDRALAS